MLNKKIETIKVPIVQHITKYKTTDGQLFLDLDSANIHQGKIDGTIKDCDLCSGKGGHFELRNIPKPGYPAYLPDSGWVTQEVKLKINCKKCKGKGYLVLNWS